MDKGLDQAVRDVAARWQEAWNRHDMSMMATLLTDDADWVSVMGAHWKGRAEIERIHAELHRQQLRSTVWHTREVQARLLQPALVLAHIRWTIEGDADAGATPRQPRNGVFTWILAEQSGRWLIRAAQGTNEPGAT